MGLYLLPFADNIIPQKLVFVKRYDNINLIYMKVIHNIKAVYIICHYALYGVPAVRQFLSVREFLSHFFGSKFE